MIGNILLSESEQVIIEILTETSETGYTSRMFKNIKN